MRTRNLAGGVLVAIGLIVASLAWTGFSMTRTIFNPDRSEEVARHLYKDPFVKDFLEGRLAQAVAAQVPLELGVANRDIKAAAASAMESTDVESAFVDALGTVHRQLLGIEPKVDDSLLVTSPALADEVRFDLVKEVPGLGNALGSFDTLAIDLPVDSLPEVGSWRSKLLTGVNILAGLAVVLVAVAFVITSNRPGILRRVGFWAVGAAAFWIVLAVVIPVAAPVFLPERAALIGGFWGVAAQGMRTPAIVAAASGAVAVVLSFIWSGAAKYFVGSGTRRGTAPHQRAPHIPATPYATPTRAPAPGGPPPPAPTPTYGSVVNSYSPPAGTPVMPGETSAPTVHQPPAPPQASQPPPTNNDTRAEKLGAVEQGPRWVEGKGYIDE